MAIRKNVPPEIDVEAKVRTLARPTSTSG